MSAEGGVGPGAPPASCPLCEPPLAAQTVQYRSHFLLTHFLQYELAQILRAGRRKSRIHQLQLVWQAILMFNSQTGYVLQLALHSS